VEPDNHPFHMSMVGEHPQAKDLTRILNERWCKLNLTKEGKKKKITPKEKHGEPFKQFQSKVEGICRRVSQVVEDYKRKNEIQGTPGAWHDNLLDNVEYPKGSRKAFKDVFNKPPQEEIEEIYEPPQEEIEEIYEPPQEEIEEIYEPPQTQEDIEGISEPLPFPEFPFTPITQRSASIFSPQVPDNILATPRSEHSDSSSAHSPYEKRLKIDEEGNFLFCIKRF
jgi:hypothetical protein